LTRVSSGIIRLADPPLLTLAVARSNPSWGARNFLRKLLISLVYIDASRSNEL